MMSRRPLGHALQFSCMCKGLLPDSSVGVKETGSETTPVERVCNMHIRMATCFLISRYKSDSHATRQAASHRRQNICTMARGLLQASAVHERQARPLIST